MHLPITTHKKEGHFANSFFASTSIGQTPERSQTRQSATNLFYVQKSTHSQCPQHIRASTNQPRHPHSCPDTNMCSTGAACTHVDFWTTS
jgi:hypothetical protein